MTIFELVKIALDELYAEGELLYGNGLDAKIKKEMVYLTESYKELTDFSREPVNYKDPATRFSYVYKYVTAHGDYLVQVLQELRSEIGNIFSSENARVSCIGGGPGSDIIAILKYLDEYCHKEPVKKVICYLLDHEQAWADTWTELDASLATTIGLNANFQPFDVIDPTSWVSQKKFLQADLFTMSFFVSEVVSLDKNGLVSAFWNALFKGAKSGALFLYVDNGHAEFNDYFDKLWKAAGLEVLLAKDNISLTPRYTEDKSELVFYTKKFDHAPKLKSYISYRVLKKP